jgi:hypothetical protein
MTLSKVEWRAVRPDKLRNLDAAKLMEALRHKPGDSIGEWQDFLADCDELERLLDRTPRMLLKTMTQSFRVALAVWHDDIAGLRKDGKRALADLGHAYVDRACSEVARPVVETAQGVVAAVRAQIKADKKRPAAERDGRTHDRLTTEMRVLHDRIRDLRRDKMKTQLKHDRMAQDIIRGKHVRMGRFRMSCDPVLKGLLRAFGDLQKQYDKLMEDGPRSARSAVA